MQMNAKSRLKIKINACIKLRKLKYFKIQLLNATNAILLPMGITYNNVNN